MDQLTVKDEYPTVLRLGSRIAVRFAKAGLREDLPELRGEAVKRIRRLMDRFHSAVLDP